MEYEVQDWGLIPFKTAWDKQTALFEPKVQEKLNATREGRIPEVINQLILCEHTPVYTLGKSGKEENLLLNPDQLAEKGIDYYKINRGGDITFHGPGQLVAYPIFDLEQSKPDIHLYMRNLEEVIIQLCKEYNIEAELYQGYTGVWINPKIDHQERKICAMGVKCSRWITMHGLALNVNTDLSYFNNIIPCGIEDKAVTSIEKEKGQKINMDELKDNFLYQFKKIFN
jgi:lipoyl(octanoyl) transferase